VTAHGTDVANAEESLRLRRATRAVLRDASAVVAVSDDLASRLRAVADAPLDGRLHVVSAGVDVTRFHDGDRDVAATALGWDGPGPRYACVGNLVPVKNLDRLLEAFAAVRREEGGSLALVGGGPLEPALRDQAARLALGDAVRFAGEVTPADVPRWLRASHAACLVSEREGFGLAAVEALACGRPVALSRSTGAAAVVRDGVTGVLCDPADVDSIAGALRAAARLEPGPAAVAAAAPYALERETGRMVEILAGAVRPRRA
jgi:glycogen(starch) synthase